MSVTALLHVCWNRYSSGLSSAPAEAISKNNSSPLTCIVYATSKYIYSPVNSALRPLCSHTGSCKKRFQTICDTMTIRSRLSRKMCFFREFSQTFPLHFHSVWGRKAESQIVCHCQTAAVDSTSSVTKITRTYNVNLPDFLSHFYAATVHEVKRSIAECLRTMCI